MNLLGLSLGCNTFDGLSHGLFVAQELHRHDWLNIFVQFINEWNAGWKVQRHDGLVGQIVQMFDNATQTVAVRSDDDLLALLQLRHNHIVPVWQRTCDGQFQRFEFGELFWFWVASVAWIFGDGIVVWMIGFHWWWRCVETATPDLNLLFTVLGSRLGLIQTSQTAIVAFIQAPRLADWNSSLTRFGENRIQSVLGTGQQRRMGDIEFETGIFDGFASSGRLVFACMKNIM